MQLPWGRTLDADRGIVIEETKSTGEEDRSGNGEGKRVYPSQEQKRLLSALGYVWCYPPVVLRLRCCAL